MDQISNSMRKVVSLLEAGDTEAARAIIAKILKANPRHAQAWYLLSFVVQTLDRQIYSLQRTLRIDPDHVEAKARLAELAGKSSKDVPTPELEKRVADSLQEAASLLKAGNVEIARAILRGTLRADPNYDQAWYLMSFADPTQRGQINALKQTLRLNPDHEEAKARLSKVRRLPIGREPTSAWEKERFVDPLHEADSLLKVGDAEAAYTILKGTLKDNPDQIQAWYLMSFADPTRRGQINALKHALRLNSGHMAAMGRLAELTGQPVIPKPVPVRVKIRRRSFKEILATLWGNITAQSALFSRLAKYTMVRGIVLFLTVVVAVYLTIFVANLGGYVDEVVRNNIHWSIAGMRLGGWLNDVPVEERNEIIEQTMLEMEEAAGLNEPFLIRCLRWLGRGLTLNWGESSISSGSKLWSSRSRDIRLIILENLPRTLLIFGTANLFLFFTSIFLALPLTKRYGGWLDRLVITLSPMSSAPSWVFGVILNLFFIRLLGIMSTGGTFDAWPEEFSLAYLPIVLKQMLLPFLAIFFSGLFQGVYAWRTFFLIYSGEDHVEMAKAKGLPPRMLERKYILRPVLPYLITSFALLFIVLWQEVIALEHFFNVAGIGRLFVNALRAFDTPVIVGLVVTFAYLLAITIFFLDLLYALVDPRVRIGSESETASKASRKRKREFRLRRSPKPLITQKLVSNPHSGFNSSTSRRARFSLSNAVKGLWKRVDNLKSRFRELARYPSALVGLAIIVVLVGVSIYTVFAIPYDKAIELWRGGEDAWSRNPKAALPVWVNLFRKDDLPKTIILDSRKETASKSVNVISETMTEITISFPFDYPYGAFPQELAVHIDAQYDEKLPQLSLIWLTPDGREIEIGTYSIHKSFSYFLSQDKRLQRKLGEQDPIQMMFANPTMETPSPLNGIFEMQVSVFVFEEGADVDAEFVLYGQVYGLAGTDYQRRDLMVTLLWGMPVALAFGLLAAVGTSFSTMVIAAIGTWFGGWVDNLVQRITEVNMVLPFLPVSLMIYTLYSKSFWVILGVTVLLSIFGNAVKNYRAIFLQVKQEPYIEVARSYSASDFRIIFRYIIPRIIPVLIPQLVILVPSYVFLETTLAFLGVSDPVLPTWGKLLVEGLSRGTYSGDYHLVLEPLSLLMLIGFAFVMLGIALERIFQPRLREI